LIEFIASSRFFTASGPDYFERVEMASLLRTFKLL